MQESEDRMETGVLSETLMETGVSVFTQRKMKQIHLLFLLFVYISATYLPPQSKQTAWLNMVANA